MPELKGKYQFSLNQKNGMTRNESIKRDCIRMTNNDGIEFIKTWCTNNEFLEIEQPSTFNDGNTNFFHPMLKDKDGGIHFISLPYKNSGCKASNFGNLDFYVNDMADNLKKLTDKDNKRICFFHYRKLAMEIVKDKIK